MDKNHTTNENDTSNTKPITTEFTRLFNIKYPIIGAPMFLVSNVDMVVAISEAGGLGTFPALNFRPIETYAGALKKIKARTSNPIGVNIIVNKGNPRQNEDLKYALEAGVEFFITSLGNPKTVIEEAHKNGAKVFCDVTNLSHAKKVQDLGADGVIAVAAGAGGHAGPISPLVLIPWLKNELSIPIVLAGGVAGGAGLAAALALGACAVSVGTRFIASHEAAVDSAYKHAILRANPEDIVMTAKISGTPASVINNDYVRGLESADGRPSIASELDVNSPTTSSSNTNQAPHSAAQKPSWKTVWSAGQDVGLINELLTCREIVEQMVREYHNRLAKMSAQMQN